MRVLLIEDDSAMARSIELMLRSEGLNVYTTDLGEEGIDLGKLYDYDIIVLDLQLPDMSGFEVLKALRVAKVQTPVLILSGNAIVEAKVKALGFGADDYMTKPFHKDELVARIQAVVRRSKGHSQSVITTGKLTVNLDAKTVEVDGARVHLTGKEYQMLELLSLRKGTTLTKEMFLNHLYGGMDEPELKIIDVFICKLRKKLAAATDGATHRDRLGPWLCAARSEQRRGNCPVAQISSRAFKGHPFGWLFLFLGAGSWPSQAGADQQLSRPDRLTAISLPFPAIACSAVAARLIEKADAEDLPTTRAWRAAVESAPIRRCMAPHPQFALAVEAELSGPPGRPWYRPQSVPAERLAADVVSERLSSPPHHQMGAALRQHQAARAVESIHHLAEGHAVEIQHIAARQDAIGLQRLDQRIFSAVPLAT